MTGHDQVYGWATAFSSDQSQSLLHGVGIQSQIVMAGNSLPSKGFLTRILHTQHGDASNDKLHDDLKLKLVFGYKKKSRMKTQNITAQVLHGLRTENTELIYGTSRQHLSHHKHQTNGVLRMYVQVINNNFNE